MSLPHGLKPAIRRSAEPSSGSPRESPSTPSAVSEERKWNTERLGYRFGADAVSATCAASLVAPVVSSIDRSIMENASGRRGLAESIKSSLRTFFLRPHSLLFSRPTALIFCVYAGTFLTSNIIDTLTSTVQNKPATTVTAGPAKFFASSAANIAINLKKDQVFVKMFGPKTAPRPIPPPAYALFVVRDCVTILASFNAPTVLAPWFSDCMGDELKKMVNGMTVAQFVAPAAVQTVSTPLHLLGLDLYNRPTNGSAVSWRDRWEVIRGNWSVSVLARIARIVPAFGVGGVVNTKVRRDLMDGLM